ncbi:unnamed protein product [Calypogeia fissa]
MGLIPKSRFLFFQRLLFLTPFVLLAFTFMHTTSTRALPRLSFLQAARFPSYLNIEDVVFRHSIVNVKDVRSELESEALNSRRQTNTVDYKERIHRKSSSVHDEVGDDDPNPDATRNGKKQWRILVEDEEKSTAIIVHDQQEEGVSLEEKPTKEEEEEILEGVEESALDSSGSNQELAGDHDNGVDGAVSKDGVDPTEENMVDNSRSSAETVQVDNSIPEGNNVDSSDVSEDENVDSSVQPVEFSSEENENLEGSKEEGVEISGAPEDSNVDDRSVETVEVNSETKVNFVHGSDVNEGVKSSEGPPEDSNDDDHSVEVLQFSPKVEENLEGSKNEEAENSLYPVENSNGDRSDVEIEDSSPETEENSEGAREEDHPSENRHDVNIDVQSGPGDEDHDRSVTEIQTAAPTSPTKVVTESEETSDSEDKEPPAEKFRRLQKLTDNLARSGLPNTDKAMNSPNYAEDLDLNAPLRGTSPQGVPLQEVRSCEGRRAFMYTLPSKFNSDLAGTCDLVSWMSACEYFKNEGMGPNVPTDELNARGEKVLVPEGSWFLTHQYALELIFHARLKHYECLTTDVNEADLFFVPYYAGLDVMRFHFRNEISHDRRDELGLELLNWLEGQESWSRNNGVDHVFVMGKISWDFLRHPGGNWGSKLLRLPSMDKPTKLLIERDPWHERDIGVPHPTFFHPKSDDEIRTWLAHVERSERRHLVSFAGMPRPKMEGNVRGHLIQQCLDHPDDCSLLRCEMDVCLRPDQTMNLFLHSHFCMQPPGDTPTRRSVFDSLVGGCIPVLFDPQTAYVQYPWHLPRNSSSYSVFIPNDDVMSGKADIVGILKSIALEERAAMRTRIIQEIIPGLLYSHPRTKHFDFRDAFDISIEALFHRIAKLRAEKKSS